VIPPAGVAHECARDSTRLGVFRGDTCAPSPSVAPLSASPDAGAQPNVGLGHDESLSGRYFA